MDIPKEDFKWFGKGFDGFPKRLPDDTIEYAIHVLSTTLSDTQVRSKLNLILQASNDLVKKLLKDYIWQREAFSLTLKREENKWLLAGRTGFGDSVADEWVVVYLLRELSRRFPEAWVRVYDTDGEFLLIEAASALPTWLNPEVAENRVWIHGGELRIIPMREEERILTFKQALDRIAKGEELTHSPLIQEEAFYRLESYPKAIGGSMHSALVTIPRKLAYILHTQPSYTSPAVEAFYLRDPISLRPLQQSSPKDLTFPPQDFVTVSGRFNRVSYAQLRSQEFPPPKTWESVFPESSIPGEVDHREVGMKLSCGFEMLVQDPQNRDKKVVREITLLLEDLENGDDALPTESEIQSWESREDSEAWLDINFEDFDRELSGNRRRDAPMEDGGKGFGDKATQENLRKMVERFERFMNDDTAGPEGAEMDEMDFDDDEDDVDDEEDEEDEEEDTEVSFDENEFARMMREMMGLPPEDSNPAKKRVHDEDDEAEEDEEIRKLSEKMEVELNATGALDLYPAPGKMKAVKDKGKGKAEDNADADEHEEEEEDDDIQIDYNLARNLLEAFKGQAGMAGPAGNMMGLMGIQMPRDDGEKE